MRFGLAVELVLSTVQTTQRFFNPSGFSGEQTSCSYVDITVVFLPSPNHLVSTILSSPHPLLSKSSLQPPSTVFRCFTGSPFFISLSLSLLRVSLLPLACFSSALVILGRLYRVSSCRMRSVSGYRLFGYTRLRPPRSCSASGHTQDRQDRQERTVSCVLPVVTRRSTTSLYVSPCLLP